MHERCGLQIPHIGILCCGFVALRRTKIVSSFTIFRVGVPCHLMSFNVIHCHLMPFNVALRRTKIVSSFTIFRVGVPCHLMSFTVILCHSLPFNAIQCHPLSSAVIFLLTLPILPIKNKKNCTPRRSAVVFGLKCRQNYSACFKELRLIVPSAFNSV